MQLLRMLHFVAAHYGFTFTSAHLPGRCNTLADAISRNQANSSALISSQLAQIAHPVSSTIIDLVCDLEVDWTSDDWNISCALALSRCSYVNGPFVSVRVMYGIGGSASALTCCLSNVKTTTVLVRCVLRRCSTLSCHHQVLPVGGTALSDLP